MRWEILNWVSENEDWKVEIKKVGDGGGTEADGKISKSCGEKEDNGKSKENKGKIKWKMAN